MSGVVSVSISVGGGPYNVAGGGPYSLGEWMPKQLLTPSVNANPERMRIHILLKPFFIVFFFFSGVDLRPTPWLPIGAPLKGCGWSVFFFYPKLSTLNYFTGWSIANAFKRSASTGISSRWMREVQARMPCFWLPQVSREMPDTP